MRMAVPELPEDFKEFLKLLNDLEVKYLLIGGYAVGYYGYPRATADMDRDILELLVVDTAVFSSKGEARRLVSGGGVSINKQKIVSPEQRITRNDFINNKYLLVQKGKKNYFLIRVKES